jgi:hypothetical protein
MPMRYLALFLSAGLIAQQPQLNIVIVQGEEGSNIVRQRPARAPIVEVQDENHRPAEGAVVVFTLPEQCAGGEFAGGVHSLTVVADGQGRAAARGFRANGLQGQFQIRVNASANGRTAEATIEESNVAGGNVAGGHGKLIAILAAAGAAATAGALYATHSGGGSSSPATIPAGSSTTTAGRGTVH